MDEIPSDAAPGDDDVTRAEVTRAEFARADGALLQRWAFGRAETAFEIERSAAALKELEQRAALEREAAATMATASVLALDDPALAATDDVDNAAVSEHPDAGVDTRQRRRMLRTGLAGVLAAALAVPVVVTQLTLPDPDPLAIFERPATAQELELIEPMTRIIGENVTAGPRIIYSTDRGLAAVFRASTIPDGRSTEWDSYCVFWITLDTNQELTGSRGQCAAPPRFDRSGVVIEIGTPIPGESSRAVQWGPAGAPVVVALSEVRTNAPADQTPLDLLAFPGAGGPGGATLEGIGDSSRLLMGPATVLTTGSDAEQLDISLFLQRSRVTEGGEPLLCVRGFVTYAPAAIGCRPLDAALSEGITLYVPSREGGWFVEVRPDGVVHAEIVSDEANVAVTTVPGG